MYPTPVKRLIPELTVYKIFASILQSILPKPEEGVDDHSGPTLKPTFHLFFEPDLCKGITISLGIMANESMGRLLASNGFNFGRLS